MEQIESYPVLIFIRSARIFFFELKSAVSFNLMKLSLSRFEFSKIYKIKEEERKFQSSCSNIPISGSSEKRVVFYMKEDDVFLLSFSLRVSVVDV